MYPYVIKKTGGKPATYTVTIKNEDPKDCPTADFALSGDMPSGWKIDFGTTVSIKPGSNPVPMSFTITPIKQPVGTKKVFTIVATNLETKNFVEFPVTYQIPAN